VHIGSGTPELLEVESSDGRGTENIVVAAMTTNPSDGRAVIPGSSMKGAVRAVFEVLTSSCAATDRACSKCAACQTFGAPGLRGRAGFDDVVFERPPEDVIDSPQRYGGTSRDRQRRRFYLPTPEQSQARAVEYLQCAANDLEAAVRLTVRGVDQACLGAILASLGAAPDTLPYLRVGGGKNRALGIVTLTARSLRLAPNPVAVLSTQPRSADAAELTGWVQEARRRFGEFDRVLGELRDHYNQGFQR
jgi:hypothetical protein